MTEIETRRLMVVGLVDQIRGLAGGLGSPSEFLQELQAEIETIPGAWVSFSSRDIGWVRSNGGFEDIKSDAEAQALLIEASLEYDDGYAASDEIGALIRAGLAENDNDPEVS